MSHFADAAARYCEAKEQERALVRGMRACERRAFDDDGLMTVDFCSRQVEPDELLGRLISESEWCEACRANLPAVDELRKIRRRLPGLMSAMRRAFRADAMALGAAR